MRHLTIQQMPELPYAVEEAMNRLRINVGFCGRQYKKIMVISSEPEEGKSFVTFRLWRMFAESGTPSVLLDADMRGSAIPETYRLDVDGESKGLSDYLSGTTALEEVLYETNFPNGCMIPNFTNIVNPSLLLEGGRFADLLDELGERFEYVFVDSPPLGLVSDGERIGALCDGAILIVRAGSTPKNLIRSSIAQLERAGCPLLGVVLNRAYAGSSGYYSKYGKRYYGRYQSSQKEQAAHAD